MNQPFLHVKHMPRYDSVGVSIRHRITRGE